MEQDNANSMCESYAVPGHDIGEPSHASNRGPLVRLRICSNCAIRARSPGGAPSTGRYTDSPRWRICQIGFATQTVRSPRAQSGQRHSPAARTPLKANTSRRDEREVGRPITALR
jgi:hypothetical protein